MSPNSRALFVFRVDQQRYALPLETVERVTRAAAVTPVAHAPAALLGILNVQGKWLPVLNSRRLLALPERELMPEDLFILACCGSRRLILLADAVEDVLVIPAQHIASAEALLGRAGPWQGLLPLDDGMALIQDLAVCLHQCGLEGLVLSEGGLHD